MIQARPSVDRRNDVNFDLDERTWQGCRQKTWGDQESQRSAGGWDVLLMEDTAKSGRETWVTRQRTAFTAVRFYTPALGNSHKRTQFHHHCKHKTPWDEHSQQTPPSITSSPPKLIKSLNHIQLFSPTPVSEMLPFEGDGCKAGVSGC